MLATLWTGFLLSSQWITGVSTSTGAAAVTNKSPDVWITVGNTIRSEGSWAGGIYHL